MAASTVLIGNSAIAESRYRIYKRANKRLSDTSFRCDVLEQIGERVRSKADGTHKDLIEIIEDTHAMVNEYRASIGLPAIDWGHPLTRKLRQAASKGAD